MHMDLLDQLLDHDHWATAHLLDRCRVLTDQQLDQEFDVGLRTIRATFEHMIPNVEVWTEMLTGQSSGGQQDDSSLPSLIDRHERSSTAFAAMARRLRDQQRLDDTFEDHYAVRKSLGGTVLMIINHNEGHRCEIVHILTRLGLPDPPEVDYGVWDYMQHNE